MFRLRLATVRARVQKTLHVHERQTRNVVDGGVKQVTDAVLCFSTRSASEIVVKRFLSLVVAVRYCAPLERNSNKWVNVCWRCFSAHKRIYVVSCVFGVVHEDQQRHMSLFGMRRVCRHIEALQTYCHLHAE